MAPGNPPEYRRGLETAFRLCSEAMDILDACGAPWTIGTHIEAAIREMKQALADERERPS